METAQLPWALRVPRGPMAAGTDFEVGIAAPEKPESFLWSKPLRFRKNLNTLPFMGNIYRCPRLFWFLSQIQRGQGHPLYQEGEAKPGPKSLKLLCL